MGESTKRKILTVYGCKGTTFHVIAGQAILRHGVFECPYCQTEVYDISDTPLGREFFARVRPDINMDNSPPPLRIVRQ